MIIADRFTTNHSVCQLTLVVARGRPYYLVTSADKRFAI